ncbi:hypothetical protein [Nocardia thailandica]|uniref:hypothetical protein n=1 Tax=Nocardia thailandica TaxID=257275 RepID=UPI0012F76519|nr:hypothetical protein [Nocardia thailandica]
MEFPVYYHYFGRTLRVDDHFSGFVLDQWTGYFEVADFEEINRATSNLSHPEIWTLSFDEFVLETEAQRMHHSPAPGPIAELYSAALEILENAYRNGHRPPCEEHDRVDNIFRRSYLMWDDLNGNGNVRPVDAPDS